MVRHGITSSLLVAALMALGAGQAVAATKIVQVGKGGADTFSPQNVTINPHDTVMWNWVKPATDVHSVTSGTLPPTGNGMFDTGLQSAPFTFSEKFDHPGVYHYFCLEHYLTGMLGTVTVAGLDPPPTAAFTPGTTSPATGQLVTFDATGSSTSDADTIESYTWDFGDGSAPQVTQTPTVTHAFAQAGTTNVTLTIIDAGSASSAPVAHQLTVQPPTVQPPPDTPPTASFTFQPGSQANSSTVSFDASASADGDGDSVAGYRWIFGDGASQATTTATTTHTYATNGTFTAQLIVLDSRGTQSLPTTLTVKIAAPPSPPASATASPPRISDLRLGSKSFCARKTHRCRHPGTRLHLSLSEPASVVVTVRRRGGKRTLVRVKLVGRTGKNSLVLSGAGLKPGRYVVTVAATSGGVRGKPRRANFTVFAR